MVVFQIPPARGGTTAPQPLGEPEQAAPLLRVPGEHVGDRGRLGPVGPHAGRVARPVRVDAEPVGRRRPGQEEAGLQLAQAAAAHALADQAALVLRHRAADLQQQLVVGIPAHRPVEELDLAARGGDLLDQQHLVHVVARQPVGRGDQHPVEDAQGGAVAQPLQAGTPQAGAAAAVIAEDVLLRHRPALPEGVRPQAIELLGDAVGLRLPSRGHPRVESDPHG